MGQGGGFSMCCQQTCFLLGLLCLPADDFLEPEEYAEPQEAKPGEAAELGRSEGGCWPGGHEGPLRTGEGGQGVAHGHSSS